MVLASQSCSNWIISEVRLPGALWHVSERHEKGLVPWFNTKRESERESERDRRNVETHCLSVCL